MPPLRTNLNAPADRDKPICEIFHKVPKMSPNGLALRIYGGLGSEPAVGAAEAEGGELRELQRVGNGIR